jgi:hypothetical protein
LGVVGYPLRLEEVHDRYEHNMDKFRPYLAIFGPELVTFGKNMERR